MNKEYLVFVLRCCYRKYKSYLFYSNNLEFSKITIATFENDKDSFNKSLDSLASALINEDQAYFNSLLKKIKVFVAP